MELQIRNLSKSYSDGVQVPCPAWRAGVDPYHKLITRREEGLIRAKFSEVKIDGTSSRREQR